MLNSELVIGSIRRSPLWVAAFCLKNLKKSHVFEIDISSSVEKILRDEMDFVSYRVMAYLLLGVVRIYSKKVEYLFHDCNEVLIKINKFVTNTKGHAPVETLRMSVTIPDRFELDAFDLDILEDADGGHIASQEEITLKDVLCKTEGFGKFSQEKFEEFDVDENTCSSDHLMLEGVNLSCLLNMDLDDCSPNSPINLLESRDISGSSIFSQKEPINVDTVLIEEGVEKESVCLFAQAQQINDQIVQEIVLCEDEIHEERSRISQEEYRDISMLSGTENAPVVFVEVFNESHQVDNIAVKETSSSLSQMNQEIIEVQEAKSFQESIERPQNEKSYGEECMHQGEYYAAKEILEDLIEGTTEKLSFIPPQSKSLDVTPQSKFQGGSVGRQKAGATTPDLMLISTPAVRERARSSTKRKIVLDEMIVLPNEVLRKSIHDASDLVSNRRKFCRTLLTLQRESLISTLPDRLYESLLPCYSPELRHLFSKKKMKILNSLDLEIVETLGKVDMSESQTFGSPENLATTPQTPPQCPGSLVIEVTPRKLDVSESQASGSPQHIATAPQTPPLCQKIKVRSIEHPQTTDIQNSDNLGPSSPHESIEGEQTFERHAVLNLMEEEIISCGTEDSELLVGWSDRTRKVASFLDQSFLHVSKQREGHVVMNFSQVLGGRLRKECARLFYEILVLSTTGYIDVKQNRGYGDIAISKHSKLDQTL